MEAVKFLPFEGRGTIRRMVEGHVRQIPLRQALAAPATSPYRGGSCV